MPHIIFLNGPPRSGKDTIGQIITEVMPQARTHKLAHALKAATHAMLAGLRLEFSTVDKDNHMPNADFGPLIHPGWFEANKEQAGTYFLGRTPREMYIAVSELLCKPMFGQDFFGRLVAGHIRENPTVPVWAITDSGFDHEATPIIREFGRENCTLVRVHRDGCTFAGDSRSYIDLDVPTKLDLNNNGTLDELTYLVRTAVLGKIQ